MTNSTVSYSTFKYLNALSIYSTLFSDSLNYLTLSDECQVCKNKQHKIYGPLHIRLEYNVKVVLAPWDVKSDWISYRNYIFWNRASCFSSSLKKKKWPNQNKWSLIRFVRANTYCSHTRWQKLYFWRTLYFKRKAIRKHSNIVLPTIKYTRIKHSYLALESAFYTDNW